MRIAVIGSGVSGLVSAYALGREHDVTLFESDARLGGHVHTVPVASPHGTIGIDTGFIVYNRLNYPLFDALLNRLGVPTKPTDMSFGVRDDRTGCEYAGRSLNTLFAQRRNLLRPAHWRLLADIRRFMREAQASLSEHPDEELGAFIARCRYSRIFTEQFLLPIGSSIWSCPRYAVRRFPARFVVQFLSNHGVLRLRGRSQWRVVVDGSTRYVEKLVAATRACILPSTPVTRLSRTASGICVQTASEAIEFDEAVVACHSDQALALLEDPTPEERSVLSAIRYQPNDVALHTDTSVLARSRRAWASWNYRVPTDSSDDDTSGSSITYNMNLLQGLAPTDPRVGSRTFCVSLNQTAAIGPDRVLGRFVYDHPLATLEGQAGRARRNVLIRHGRISYCGAYWGNGFHEDGVRSASEVCQAFGVELG
jgi:uncharacterized protein